jgi:hypothetical protein
MTLWIASSTQVHTRDRHRHHDGCEKKTALRQFRAVVIPSQRTGACCDTTTPRHMTFLRPVRTPDGLALRGGAHAVVARQHV